MGKSLKFNFPDFQMAWEGLNEFLANNVNEISEQGYGAIYGTEIVLYNSLISIELSRVNPDFNFGRVLGYKIKKWTKLVGNYIDFNYLDLVKSEVTAREAKKASSYNYTFHFDNSHGSGKDCLISLTFQRRVDEPDPIIIFTTRASEVTKRMIFDFLLLQRMAEYVYGPNKRVKAELYMPMMYINVESFLIYLSHYGLGVLKKEKGEYSKFQDRIIKRYHEFLNTPLEQIKYKVHKRAAMQVQKNTDGTPVSNSPNLFAKNLVLQKKPMNDGPAIILLNQGL